MNIQRFKWPAIVAASLHGALFSLSPDQTVVHVTPDKPPVLPPVVVDPIIQMDDTDTPSADTAPAGSEHPLPNIPDKPAPLQDETGFTVPVTERVTTFDKNELHTIDTRPPGVGNGFGDGKQVTFINSALLDCTPRARVQRSPDYPPTLKNAGIGGSVTVEFDVNGEGRVIRAEATGYTHREFVEPALRAVRTWRFEPGRRDGRVVSFRMVVPIEFGIEAN